jgi:hypothetical protein
MGRTRSCAQTLVRARVPEGVPSEHLIAQWRGGQLDLGFATELLDNRSYYPMVPHRA